MIMKKQSKTVIAAILLSVPLAGFGGWQEINNFNSGSFEGINTFDTNHSENFETFGIVDIVNRPFGGEGRSLATSAGFGLFNDFHVWMSMPPIEQGTDGTVYLEFAQTDEANNTVFGTIIAEDPIGDTLPRWGNFYALARASFGSFDIYDLNGYVNIDFIESATWYQIWMHVDNALDEFSLYVKGGKWEEQTLVYEGAIFRNEISISPMINFLIIQAAGNQTNPTSGQYVYWDNLYVDPTGLNLTVPEVDVDPVDPVENPFDALAVGEWTVVEHFGLTYGFAEAGDWGYHYELGFLFTDSFPWLYHPEEGFVYYEDGDYEGEGLILYSINRGWIGLNASNPGWIYIYSEGEWVDPGNAN